MPRPGPFVFSCVPHRFDGVPAGRILARVFRRLSAGVSSWAGWVLLIVSVCPGLGCVVRMVFVLRGALAPASFVAALRVVGVGLLIVTVAPVWGRFGC